MGDATGHEQDEPPVEGTWRYRDQLRWPLVTVLTLALVVLGLVGWETRPTSSGPQNTDTNIVLGVDLSGIDAAAGQGYCDHTNNGCRYVHESVYSLPTGGTMVILANRFSRGPWTVTVQPLPNLFTERLDPGGADQVRPCPRTQLPTTAVYPYGGPALSDDTQRTRSTGRDSWNLSGTGRMLVQLCWDGDGPLRIGGGSLAADLPEVDLPDSGYQLTAAIVFPPSDPAYGYTITSPVQPTYAASTALYWQDSAQAQPSQGLHVTGVNLQDQQRETKRAFVAGIALGVAGAILIELIKTLVDPLADRRKARRHRRAAAGGTQA